MCLHSLLASFERAWIAACSVLQVLEKHFAIFSDGLIFVNALFECLIHVLGNTVQYFWAFLVLKQYKTEVKMSFSTTQYSASKRPLDFKSSHLAPHDWLEAL